MRAGMNCARVVTDVFNFLFQVAQMAEMVCRVFVADDDDDDEDDEDGEDDEDVDDGEDDEDGEDDDDDDDEEIVDNKDHNKKQPFPKRCSGPFSTCGQKGGVHGCVYFTY